MSSGDLSSSCFVCLRKLTEGRGVKGSARLRHSGTLVSEATGIVLGHEITFSRLCFRCYRLILGIDFHKLELEKLKETFLKLYSERSVVNIAVEENDKSHLSKISENDSGRIINQTGVSDEGVKEEGLPSSRNSEFTPSHDHGYCRNARDKQAENCKYREKKNEVKCFANENILRSSTPCEEQEQKSRNMESEEGLKGTRENESNNLDTFNYETTNRVQEKLIREMTLDSLQNFSPKRRKIAKKMKDYEYYTENSQIFDVGLPNDSGIFLRECDITLTPNKTQINCNLCKRDFTSKKKYITHDCFKKKKKANISYTCKGCQNVFAVRRDYIKHIDSCYKNMPVSCHICLIKLPSAAYLPRHLKSFHEGPAVIKKGCLCDQCGRSFSRKEALERHQAQVHGLSHGTHQCPKCGRTFPHTSLLAEHLRAHKGYTCTECKKIFSCMSNLTLHKRVHHQKKALYHCSRCNKRWRFHYSYTYHMRKLHGLAQHKCSKCKLLFSAEGALERHKEICVTHREETKIVPSNAKTTKAEKVGRESECQGISKIVEQKTKRNSSLTTNSKDKTLSSKLGSNIAIALSRNEIGTNIQTCKDATDRLQELSTEITSKHLSVLNKKTVHPDMSPVSPPNTVTYTENEDTIEPKDTIVFMPPVTELKEEEVVYHVSGQEPVTLVIIRRDCS